MSKEKYEQFYLYKFSQAIDSKNDLKFIVENSIAEDIKYDYPEIKEIKIKFLDHLNDCYFLIEFYFFMKQNEEILNNINQGFYHYMKDYSKSILENCFNIDKKLLEEYDYEYIGNELVPSLKFEKLSQVNN